MTPEKRKKLEKLLTKGGAAWKKLEAVMDEIDTVLGFHVEDLDTHLSLGLHDVDDLLDIAREEGMDQ